MLGRVAAVLVFLAPALVFVGPSIGAAQAADRRAEAKARQHYKQGMRHYDLGRFDDAIREFETAYQFNEDPFFIYNLAQAHRRAGNLAKALELYRTYLRKAPNAADRADVERRIAVIEQSMPPPFAASAERPAAPLAVTPPPPQPQVRAPRAQVSMPPEETRPRSVEARPPPDVRDRPTRSSSMVVAGAVTAVAGIVAAGAGVALAVSANGKFDDVRNAPVYDPDREDEAKRTRTFGYVFIGVGAAALATGATLFILGMDSEGGGRRTALLPAIDSRSLGLALRGSF